MAWQPWVPGAVGAMQHEWPWHQNLWGIVWVLGPQGVGTYGFEWLLHLASNVQAPKASHPSYNKKL